MHLLRPGADTPWDSQKDTLRSPAMNGPANSEPSGIQPGVQEEYDDQVLDARRARWTASGTGALLALAGLAAAALRAAGSAPALVPAAYAFGAAVCVLAALLGSRGRTRRALWLLIAGVMVMALGDQFD